MLFGAHVSVGKGYRKMADYVEKTGCECIQIFAKSPQQWKAKPLSAERIAEMRDVRGEGRVGPVLTHTSYLLNLAGPKDDLREKSVAALSDELVRASLLGAEGANTHLGTCEERAWADAREGDERLSDASLRAAQRAGSAIADAWERAERELAAMEDETGGALPRTRLLLEDTAGAGSVFGSSVAELGAVVEASGLPVERVGITIDTCHAWAAGYDVATRRGWDDLIDRIERLVGLDRFLWIHANDCLHGRGEHKDRHAWCGHGCIGAEGFAAMVANPKVEQANAVCEVPGDEPDKDIVNVAFLKGLRDGEAPDEALARSLALCPGAEPVGI
jgi:deoxyribonuclease-4